MTTKHEMIMDLLEAGRYIEMVEIALEARDLLEAAIRLERAYSETRLMCFDINRDPISVQWASRLDEIKPRVDRILEIKRSLNSDEDEDFDWDNDEVRDANSFFDEIEIGEVMAVIKAADSAVGFY